MRDVPRIAVELEARDMLPELIMASGALRTRQTAELFKQAVKPDIPIIFDDTLYLASAYEIFQAVRATPDDIRSVMFVGHNPGMQQLAQQLGGADLNAGKFPTAATVALALEAETWKALNPTKTTLSLFLTPKSLK
mgnify:FL=1